MAVIVFRNIRRNVTLHVNSISTPAMEIATITLIPSINASFLQRLKVLLHGHNPVAFIAVDTASNGTWFMAPCKISNIVTLWFMFSQMRLFSSESCGRYWDTLYQLSSSVTHLSISCQASKSFQIWNRFGIPGSQSFAKHLRFPSTSNPPSLPHFIGVRCQQGFHIRRVFLHREPRRVTTLAAPWKRFAMKVEVENGWTST